MSDSFSSQLTAALRTLAGMARLKSGPEDLPASLSLLVAIIVLATILDLLTLAVVPLPDGVSSALLLAVGTGTTLAWYGAILQLASRPERFLQTLTAVFGIQIILAPVLVFTAWFYVTYQADPGLRVPAVFMRTLVEIWALVLLARILRSATGWHMVLCVGLAIANEVITFLLIAAVLPQAAPPAVIG